MEHTSVCLYGNDLGNLRDARGGCVLSVKKIDDQLYGTRRHCLQPKEGSKCCRHVAGGIHWLLPKAWYAEELQVSYIFYLWGSKCLRLWPWVLSSFVFLFVATRHFLFGFLLFHSSSVLWPVEHMFTCFLCPIFVFMLTRYVAIYSSGHCHFKSLLQSNLLHLIVACIGRHASQLAVNSLFLSYLHSF